MRLPLQQEGWGSTSCSAPTVGKAIPNLLPLCRVLVAACSPRQLPALPTHTHRPWFVNQLEVGQMRSGLLVLWCSDGVSLATCSSWGVPTMALIEWVEWTTEQEMVLASGSQSISAQSLPAFHSRVLYSLERSFLGKYSNSHASCCPSLGHGLQLYCVQNLYTAENLACRTGTLTSSFLPQRSLGK